MKTIISKQTVDIVHVYYGDDKELWSIVRSFSKNRPYTYTVICEYQKESTEWMDYPKTMEPKMINQFFNHDIISMF